MERHRAIRLTVDKLAHVIRAGAFDFLAGTLDDHLAIGQDDDIIGNRHGFLDIMRHQDTGQAQRMVGVLDQLDQHPERDRVLAGKGFVIHDHHRIQRQRPGQGDPARHPTGQLGRHQLMRTAQTHGL